MKFLTVDVGNTSTAVAFWNSGRVSCVSHHDGGFAEAAAAAEKLIASRKPDAIAYVSVVPKADHQWKRFAKRHALPLKAVDWRNADLKLDYPEPETIGADRLADAAGAIDKYGSGIVVMDFGTALTAAVITKDGVWRGGAIAPGFPLMRDYLFERTAKLPRMKLGGAKPPKIGRSTEEAMRFGAIVGYRGMVREIVATLKSNFGEDFSLVATGGFAKWVLKGLELPFTIDSTLTLYGAGLICAKSF